MSDWQDILMIGVTIASLIWLAVSIGDEENTYTESTTNNTTWVFTFTEIKK